ncbi:hypothetical protein NZK35_27360, partial [Stieleria sp. ICT_E10.1]|uniref:hypothetical protein n=1 Tax=Stieleria sedimenti TaxID=2976331 RepID=UPI00217FB6CF
SLYERPALRRCPRPDGQRLTIDSADPDSIDNPLAAYRLKPARLVRPVLSNTGKSAKLLIRGRFSHAPMRVLFHH